MEWVNTAPGHTLIGSSCGQRSMHSAGLSPLRHGSKTKDSVFIRKEFQITRARHERKHLLFSKPHNSGPPIKIEKRGYDKIIIILFISFHVFYRSQKLQPGLSTYWTTQQQKDDSYAYMVGARVTLTPPVCRKILQFPADNEHLISIVMSGYTGQLTSITYHWS